MKKILIIEDNLDEYLDIVNVLSNYEVEIYPTDTMSAIDFQQTLRFYAKSEDLVEQEKYYQEIKEICKMFNPDFILVDISLDPNDRWNKAGLELHKKFNKDIAAAKLFFLTYQSSDLINQNNYIQKGDDDEMEFGIKTLLVEPFGIQEVKNRIPTRLRSKKNTPQWILNIKDFNEYGVERFFNAFTAIIYTIVFQISLVFLALLGPYIIYTKSVKYCFDPIHVAEYTFIAFLPFLIVFGLFTFYTRSLKPFTKWLQLGPDDDTDNSSKLIMLTKKLFISSLISYLFIKIIELTILENKKGVSLEHMSCYDDVSSENLFLKYYPNANPLMQVYILAGCIVFLIVYYIILSNHKSHTEKR